ncbi:MAG TPA: hypothetical protein VKP30_00865 [Polyangiaceae bacterium]|nr:hypothetical protein [Polyangiaceae bacterium]
MPTGAIENARVPRCDLEPLARNQRISPEHAEQFLKTRRSARVYEPKIADQVHCTRVTYERAGTFRAQPAAAKLDGDG